MLKKWIIVITILLNSVLLLLCRCECKDKSVVKSSSQVDSAAQWVESRLYGNTKVDSAHIKSDMPLQINNDSIKPAFPLMDEVDSDSEKMEKNVPDYIVAKENVRKDTGKVVQEKKDKKIIKNVDKIETAEKNKLAENQETVNINYDTYIEHQPQTVEEAKAWAFSLWEKATEIASTDGEKAHIYTERAIKLYENGSLFYFRAVYLFNRQNYVAAVNAAKISISRDDHWDGRTVVQAYEIKAKAFEAIAKTYPSMQSVEDARKAKEEYDKIK